MASSSGTEPSSSSSNYSSIARPQPQTLPSSFINRHLPIPLSKNSSCSSIHEMPRPRKLRLLIASNGPKDIAFAKTIAVRLSKDAQIEIRAIVDEIPHRLAQEIMVMTNHRCEAMSYLEEDKHASSLAMENRSIMASEQIEWADLLVLAPVDANHLAKMMCGIADTFLSEILRGWDVSKKILLVPGMTTQMWENPMTKKQLSKLKRKWNWVRVMPPLLWHYEGITVPQKRVVSWDGLSELVGIIKNQADLLSLGHDVEVAAQQLAIHTDPSKSRATSTLPPEIWTIIFEFVGDWELAKSLNIYTNLRMPSEWRLQPRDPNDPVQVFMHQLEWLILSCRDTKVICKKLSEAPTDMRYLSSLVVKLIIKFSLTAVLTYCEANFHNVFWASFSGKLLPNKASAPYGREDILDWWNTSPSFLKKEYDAETLDGASRMGYVYILDWWKRSSLTLKYTEAALEQASAKGHLLVLEWWKEAALADDSILLKPGRSLLAAAQYGQTAVLRWWEASGIPVAHGEGVCKIASAHGHVTVLDLWRELKGDKLGFDNQVLVGPTKQGHVDVLEWWKQYARGEDDGSEAGSKGKKHRVEYKTCDIEEALEDAIGDSRPVRRWWARNGLNLGLRTSEWMKAQYL